MIDVINRKSHKWSIQIYPDLDLNHRLHLNSTELTSLVTRL